MSSSGACMGGSTSAAAAKPETVGERGGGRHAQRSAIPAMWVTASGRTCVPCLRASSADQEAGGPGAPHHAPVLCPGALVSATPRQPRRPRRRAAQRPASLASRAPPVRWVQRRFRLAQRHEPAAARPSRRQARRTRVPRRLFWPWGRDFKLAVHLWEVAPRLPFQTSVGQGIGTTSHVLAERQCREWRER